MLTGDKMETAENIARSCRLFIQEMQILQLDVKNLSEVRTKLAQLKDIFELCIQNNKKKGLLVDGECLSLILSDTLLQQQFLSMAVNSEAVVLCRSTPKQKAQMVRLVRIQEKKMTLAIGDGANDVNMIQEADIGIGVFGNEGMRAVQASDFAIGEFRCLWRLIFLHGRWNYIRIAEMILYFFYKNIIFTIPQLFFAFVCAYSGQTIFDDWYISLYNMFFTALPLTIRAITDQDVHYETLKKVNQQGEIVEEEVPDEGLNLPLKTIRSEYIQRNMPKIYYKGQRKMIFNLKNFAFWILTALFQAIILFIITFAIFRFGIININGYNSDLWSFSVTYFTSIVLVVDFKVAIYTRYWWFLTWIAILPLSSLFYLAYFAISNDLNSFGKVQGVSHMMFQSFLFYSTCFLEVIFLLSLDLLYYLAEKAFKPSLIDSLRQYMKKAMYIHQKIENKEKQENALQALQVKLLPTQKFKVLESIPEEDTDADASYISRDEKETVKIIKDQVMMYEMQNMNLKDKNTHSNNNNSNNNNHKKKEENNIKNLNIEADASFQQLINHELEPDLETKQK